MVIWTVTYAELRDGRRVTCTCSVSRWWKARQPPRDRKLPRGSEKTLWFNLILTTRQPEPKSKMPNRHGWRQQDGGSGTKQEGSDGGISSSGKMDPSEAPTGLVSKGLAEEDVSKSRRKKPSGRLWFRSETQQNAETLVDGRKFLHFMEFEKVEGRV
ncbi:hypothetical protein NDU88_002153 [Pleurodeles waltl]|uniref:Uncharacterized protein n=1 Tax=Pleurodeles waltl TaxID=8319 RepID=A0AAV7SBW2_PLEWA|nr:hypothetical protein NDU88_002153 [Pleurodeles waltl]